MRTKIKVMTITAVITLLYALLASPPTANAAGSCFSGGSSTNSFAVKYGAVNDTWVGYFDTARTRWNSAGVSASIGKGTSANRSVTASRYTWSDYGRYYPPGSSFKIEINARTLGEAAPSSQSSNWMKSTVTHEFGHALKLVDNPLPSSPNASLMNHGRNRNTVGSPTSTDKSTVKACYK
ncbi:MAG: hypothetical protein LBI99_07985 [Propionibacteriaceae bacterium]|jgi:hypothetical protein|nr:hypothetical protein [Propionibacteriaceae bacterium]